MCCSLAFTSRGEFLRITTHLQYLPLFFLSSFFPCNVISYHPHMVPFSSSSALLLTFLFCLLFRSCKSLIQGASFLFATRTLCLTHGDVVRVSGTRQASPSDSTHFHHY